MAEVYWIHLPEHTDLFSEGYVGVTTKSAKDRFQEHVVASTLNKKKHLKVSNAIRKYRPENLIVETLIICDIEYALDLESKLRPRCEIGWNISPGGSKPPVRKGPMGPDFSKRLSERNTGVPKSEETKRKISEKLTGTKLPQAVKNKISESVRKKIESEGLHPNSFNNLNINRHKRSPIPYVHGFWKGLRKSKARHQIAIADKIHEFFHSENGKVTSREVMNRFELSGAEDALLRLLGIIKGGWNPSEDQLWLEDFGENKCQKT